MVKKDGGCTLLINKLFLYDGALPVVWYSDAQDGVEILAGLLEGTVAVDKNFPARFLLGLQQKKPQLKLQLGTVIDEVKAIKTSQEQQKMMRASMVNDSVMAEVAGMIAVGKSESALRDEIDALFRVMSQGNSFDTIVAYGDHAADPHGVPGDRVLNEGEAVVVDMGCVVDGYCSDMTRTFFVGFNPEMELYDLVRRANMAGIAAVKPGIPFKDIDRAARKVIEDAGYGEFFTHRLGHGIGMEVHEPFDVSATDEVIVQEGSLPEPSSNTNFSSFLYFFTASQALTFTTRKSDLAKVSKSTKSVNSGSTFTLEKSMTSAATGAATGAASSAFSSAFSALGISVGFMVGIRIWCNSSNFIILHHVFFPDE